MGKRRREKALGSSLEQRIENRKLHPDGAFKNGSSRQLKIEKLNRANMKNMKKWARQRPRPFHDTVFQFYSTQGWKSKGMIPCYWGVTDLKITDCKECYARPACRLAELDWELEKNVKSAE